MTIYIVEPNASDQKLIKRILTQDGSYDCRFFETNMELLAHLESESGPERPHFVDAIMIPIDPSTGGLETAKRLKEASIFRDLPILMVAEQSQPEAIQIAFAFGASDYVEKPFREIELLARIRSSVRLKHEIERRKARERELLESARQVSDLNRLLVHLSLVDSLTGIANRRCFDVSLDREWRRAMRSQTYIALIMMDIDFFKNYNDSYGHRAGDECLSSVAKNIKRILQRPGDILARYGGEEFVAILPETDKEGAFTVAEQIRRCVEDNAIPHLGSDAANVVTISLGVAAEIPEKDATAEKFVASADRALYEAKEKGRNRVMQAS